MVHIEQWFPIHIGYVYNPFHKEIEDELTQLCLERKNSSEKVFEEFRKERRESTSGSPTQAWFLYQINHPSYDYDLKEDQKFRRLHNWIDDQVKNMTERMAIGKEIKCSQGWFNSYEKYEYTEYHHHRPNILSCVYFLNSEETGAKLLIKNNSAGDDLAAYCDTPAEYPLVSYMYHDPTPGKLVIFPAYLEHAVQQHNTDDLRITLAYNYN